MPDIKTASIPRLVSADEQNVYRSIIDNIKDVANAVSAGSDNSVSPAGVSPTGASSDSGSSAGASSTGALPAFQIMEKGKLAGKLKEGMVVQALPPVLGMLQNILWALVLSPSELQMAAGETKKVTATIGYPKGVTSSTTPNNVKWSSSDEAVLTVDASGKVTAKAAGTAKVIAKTTDNAKTSECSVDVAPAGTVIPVNYVYDQQFTQVNLYFKLLDIYLVSKTDPNYDQLKKMVQDKKLKQSERLTKEELLVAEEFLLDCLQYPEVLPAKWHPECRLDLGIFVKWFNLGVVRQLLKLFDTQQQVGTSLIPIKGISKVMQAKLRALSIYDVASLLIKGKTLEKRNNIAKAVDINVKLVNSWVKQADLWRVEGMTTDAAYLLMQIGVRSAEDLMKIDPEKAYPILERLVLAQPDFILPDYFKLEELIDHARETFGLSQNNISLNIETLETEPDYLFKKEFNIKNLLSAGKIIKDGLEFLDNLPCVLPLPSSVTGRFYRKSKYVKLDPDKDFANHLLVEINGIASAATDKSEKDKTPSAYTDSEGFFKIILPEKFNLQEGITISVSDDMYRGRQKFMLNADDIINAVPEQEIINKFDELQRVKFYIEEKEAEQNYLKELKRCLNEINELSDPAEKAECEKYIDEINGEIRRLEGNCDDIQKEMSRQEEEYKKIREEILKSDTTTNDLEKVFLNLLNRKLNADIGEFTAITEILQCLDTDVKKAMPSVKLMGNDDEAIHLSADTAPSQVFNYNMLQRLVEPDIAGEVIKYKNIGITTLPEIIKVDKRKKLDSPVDVMNFKKQMYTNPDKFPQMSSLGIGYILAMHQAWVPDGFALGDLLYSLILAPGEEQRLIVRENIQSYEISDDAEGFDSDSQHYALSQGDYTTAAYRYGMQEMMIGSSNYDFDSYTTASAKGGGGGLSLGGSYSGFSLGLGGGGSASSSKSHSWGSGSSSARQSNARNEASSAAQNFQHNIKSASNRISHSKRISVRSATSEETESVATKIIANHNHSHAMTIQYWEVMRRYRLETCIDGVNLVLFVPLRVIKFIPDGKYTLENTSNFNQDAFNSRYDTLLKYSDRLLAALPYKYRTGLNLIKKYAAYPNWKMEKTDVGARQLTLTFNCDLLSFDDLTASLTLKNKKGTIAGTVEYSRKELDDSYNTRNELDQAIRDIRNGKINKRVKVKCNFSIPAGITNEDFSHITLNYSCEGLEYKLYHKESLEAWEQKAIDNYQSALGGLAMDNKYSSNDRANIAHYESQLPESYLRPNVIYSASKIKSLGSPTISDVHLNLGGELDHMMSSYSLVSSVMISIPSNTTVLRYAELQNMEATMHHIASETVRYSQVIWASLSQDERAMMLEQYTIDMNFDDLPGNEQEENEEPADKGKVLSGRLGNLLAHKDVKNSKSKEELTIPLLNCVDVKKLLGFYGNCMLLPFTFPQKLAEKLKKTSADIQDSLYRYHTRNFRVPTTTISLPTDGMIGEAVLGETNVSEVIDITRFWNWKDSPIDKMEITSDYLNSTDYLANKTTKDISALNVQGATAATPVTVNDLITALVNKQTPTFGNITGLEQLKDVLNAGTASAASGRDKVLDSAKEYMQIAKELAITAVQNAKEQENAKISVDAAAAKTNAEAGLITTEAQTKQLTAQTLADAELARANAEYESSKAKRIEAETKSKAPENKAETK